MCGIAGILSLNNTPIKLERIKLMTDSISHRGPDGEGQWISNCNKIGLGHRRLSIIDLSESANQPFHYLDRYVIAFNGEIYNYVELKLDLVKSGYSFATKSDTEVLVALYDQHKENCLSLLDGMFSISIWDKVEKKLFCARDRFGEKPFFYSANKNEFIFGSEIKALFAAGIEKSPSEDRIFRYLAYDQMNSHSDLDKSFYNNVNQLKPGHYMIVTPEKPIIQKKYWSLDYNFINREISYEEAVNKFNELFSLSIQRRLRSDVPVGSSLSGGLDSSSIVYTIQDVKEKEKIQRTFSAVFPNFNKDESKLITIINNDLATESYQKKLNSDTLMNELDNVLKVHSEPFGSTSIIAQHEVMKLAKEHKTTVLLDGQGADEYLAGYQRYITNYLFALRASRKNNYETIKSNLESFYSKKFSLSAKERFFYKHVNTRDWFRNIKNRLKSPDYLNQFNAQFLKKNQASKYRFNYGKSLNEALFNDMFFTSLPTLLRYADRNSMNNQREVRLPFLYHELVEFVFSLPDEFKIREGWSKAILRDAMKDKLPEAIIWNKQKIGFEPPKNKKVPEQKLKSSIQLLIQKGILDEKNIINSKAWEYVQIANLYA